MADHRTPLTYLDWAATTPPDPDILNQMNEVALSSFGNPSSLHRAGREAETALGEARRRLCALVGLREDELIFTSGGTESNNLVALSPLSRKGPRKVIASGIEHPSLYEPLKGLGQFGHEVVLLRASSSGRIDPAQVERELDERTVLVTLMLVNNETGAIQPVREVAEIVRDYSRRLGRRIHLHTDAVQALGKIPFRPAELGVDSAAQSGHKIRGPRGIGALVLRREGRPQFLPAGGGQEMGLRPGTENLPGAWGLMLAVERRLPGLEEEMRAAERRMEYLLAELESIESATLIPAQRREEMRSFSPWILNVSFPPIPGEVLVRALEEKGVLISTGSACSSKKKNRFRVSENMGLPPRTALSAVRISQGYETRQADLERLVEALRSAVPALLKVAR